MGRNSGSSRGGDSGNTGASSGYRGKEPDKWKTIGEMKNKDTAKMLMKAVSKFETTFGLPTRKVRVASLPSRIGGVHFDASDAVYLNSKYFERPLDDVKKWSRTSRGMHGWDTRTSKPEAHVITHELAHSLWHGRQSDPQSKAMGVELRTLFKQYLKDKNKKGYGKYSKTNLDEFFAETTAAVVNPRYHSRTVNGRTVAAKPDYYVDEVRKIIKKYRGKK